MGALIAARLVRYVHRALRLDIHSLSCWRDSEVTLAWIQSVANQWKPFVRNRVEEIQQLVEPTSWRHCPGKSNPADVLSRGAALQELSKNRCWWQGPGWLSEPPDAWPKRRCQSDRPPPSPPNQDRSPQAALLVSVVTHGPDPVLDPRKYNDIEQLFRITALCLRFAHNCGSSPGDRRTGTLTAPKLEASERIWVRIAQRQGFLREIETLETNGNVPARSVLCPLDPYLDAAGTLRVGGRLEKSNLPLSEKHPALLPSEHEVTRGLIIRCHVRQLHAGVSQTLFALRQRYWIPRGRSRVRQVLRGCLQCRWATGRPPQPKMADLPAVRSNPAPAFAHVGMDFAGPLFVRATRKTTSPRYVCLITCMVSRAVHLELVPEMSTVWVLQALRCFMARRGRPAVIQTDNFRSFQSAAAELRRLWQEIDVDRVQRDLAGQRIQWKFIPPRAPWMGGYWERLIRTMKESLRKVLGQALLDEEELRTVLWARRSCTPQSVPAADGSDLYRSSRSRRPRCELAENVPHGGELSAGRIGGATGNSPQPNELVLILEDNVPRRRCPLGVVAELLQGSDGVARAARLRTSTAEITRPVAKSVVLEPAQVDDGRTSSPSGVENVPDGTTPTQSSRVGKNNTRAPPARSLSEHLAAPSRGQKGLLLRPDLSAFARQLRPRHKDGSGQTKGHGSGHHDGIIKGLMKDQRIRTMTT
ncbi:hypothetical protein T06_16732 [Trichinella sp. T6]|nr:hypothetical protein T06_16732 [Trichinella sp. T6]